jgi:putative membrane protein insertion efficiency factor
MMRKFAIRLIEMYQVSTKHKTPTCRYSPTCSEYSKQAFEHKPFLVAMVLSAWRILRCNPFSKGGYDPVPGTHKE